MTGRVLYWLSSFLNDRPNLVMVDLIFNAMPNFLMVGLVINDRRYFPFGLLFFVQLPYLKLLKLAPVMPPTIIRFSDL
jgi:hypothetical protein